MSGNIVPIVMPKWGLAMEEGMLVEWQVEEGTRIEKGQEIADIETTKITNIFECPTDGLLRRIVTADGETVPVGFLLAVCAEEDVSDGDIDSYVEDFKANFVLEEAAGGGAEPESVEIAPGRSIRYLTMGSGGGTPILFIHGFGGGFDNWMLNQEALSEDNTTYAIDLPGHGGSTKDVGAGDLSAMMAALSDFMKIMKIEQAHLVGHSMGGGIALGFALQQPNQVASLSLIAPVGFGADINMDYIDGFISQTRARKLRGVLELLVDDASAISADMVEDIIKFKRLDGVGAALGQLRDQVMPGGKQGISFRDRLGDVSMPAQVIWGRNDKIIPSDHAADLPDNLRLTVYDDTGHMPHLERATDVNALIGEFVAS